MVLCSSEVLLSLVPLSTSSSSSCLSASHSFSDRPWAYCASFSRLSWTCTDSWKEFFGYTTFKSQYLHTLRMSLAASLHPPLRIQQILSWPSLANCFFYMQKVDLKDSLYTSSLKCRHQFFWWFYLSVLDPVFERLLEKVEGIFLSVGLNHHIPGLFDLNLHNTWKQLFSHHYTHPSILYPSIHPSMHPLTPPSLWISLLSPVSLFPSQSSALSSSSARWTSGCWYAASLHYSPADHASQTCAEETGIHHTQRSTAIAAKPKKGNRCKVHHNQSSVLTEGTDLFPIFLVSTLWCQL